MKIDKLLLAAKLKAHQGGTKQQASSNFCFSMKLVANKINQMTSITFKGDVGEIAIPVSAQDVQKLKQFSQPVNVGLWEMAMNYDNLDKGNPCVSKFVDNTIPMMKHLALKQVKINPENVKGVDIRLRKMTILEPGAKLSIPKVQNTAGVFATMIVQFPIVDGHKGGVLKVNQGNFWRTFESEVESARLFYYTVFLSDCSCEMEELSSGMRLTMTFDLVCPDPSALFFSPAISTSKEVTDILQQLNSENSDRLLAFPLNEDETSFSSLSSGSRKLVDLFSSIDFLQLRLATVSCYRMGMSNKRSGCECCLKRRCPCQEVAMVQVTQERITTVKWLDTTDRVLQLDHLEIDAKTEVVGDGPLFFDKPTEEKINIQTSVLEQWFNRPVLVIWHKTRSIRFDCFHAFGPLMDSIEHRANLKNEKEEVLRALEEIVSFCREHPEIAFKTESSSCRLLTLCVQLKACKEIIKLMDIIASYQGICSGSMPDIIAEAIQSVGLEACVNSLDRLISSVRVQDQMRHYVRLVTTLLDRGCHQAAVTTASHICKILSTGNIISSLDIPVFALCVDMMIRLDDNPLTIHPQRLVNLAGQVKEKLSKFHSLLQLLTCVQTYLNARPAERIPISAINWYSDLSLHLSAMNIPPETPSEQVLATLKLFVSIGDATLVDAFIQQLANNRNQKNGILEKLLASEDTWKLIDESAEDKGALSCLVDRRIQWLAEIPKPEPSWAYPNEEVVGHPLVQEFMRSNQQSMKYANFNNLPHARNWARKHFGFSQIAEADPFGAGRTAYCLIHKVRQRCNGNKKYLAWQQELIKLIDRRLKRLGDTACDVVLNPKTEEICLLEVQSAGNNIKSNQTIPQPGPSNAVNVTPKIAEQKEKASYTITMSADGKYGLAVSSPAPTSASTATIVGQSADGVKVGKKGKTVSKAIPANVVILKSTVSPLLNNLKNNAVTPAQRVLLPATTSHLNPVNVMVLKQTVSPLLNNFETKATIPAQSVLPASATPTSAPKPIATPKRPGVAKRPLVASFSPANVYPLATPNPPKVLVNPTVLSSRKNLLAKRALIDLPSPSENSSPSKRVKVD